MTITGKQTKAARELLGWTKAQLAREAGATPTEINSFENGKKRPAMIVLSTIGRILRTAGVEFTNGGQPGVKLRMAK
jgi:DNA-binding XRE family transcriptional regulator